MWLYKRFSGLVKCYNVFEIGQAVWQVKFDEKRNRMETERGNRNAPRKMPDKDHYAIYRLDISWSLQHSVFFFAVLFQSFCYNE